MVIRSLDDSTYCVRSAFTHLGLWRKLCDCSRHQLRARKCLTKLVPHCHMLPLCAYLAGSKSVCARPPVLPGNDDKYRSGSHRFVERQKPMTVFLPRIASLVVAECAYASLIFSSFNDVLSLVYVDPKYLNLSTLVLSQIKL